MKINNIMNNITILPINLFLDTDLIELVTIFLTLFFCLVTVYIVAETYYVVLALPPKPEPKPEPKPKPDPPKPTRPRPPPGMG